MKIMVWNIEKFTNNKLEDAAPLLPVRRKRSRSQVEQEAYDYGRRLYLQQALTANNEPDFQPDVIAILEAMAGKRTSLGHPMKQVNSSGVLNLLRYIKWWSRNKAWRMVPPLKCNPAQARRRYYSIERYPAHEVVAVYYNSNLVSFEGPGSRSKDYPEPWNGSGITGNTRKAGRVHHVDTAGKAVKFPRNQNRRPFMVDFKEKYGGERLVRTLFIHTSPTSANWATYYVGTIADMNPKSNTTGTPDFYVAGGDFNVDEWYISGGTRRWNPYDSLETKGYVKQFGTAARSTHFCRRGHAFPSIANPYGYMQKTVIDNFLINNATNSTDPDYTALVVNTVAGRPPPWTTSMESTLEEIMAWDKYKKIIFNEGGNFPHVPGTSDHAPVYLNIP